MKLSDKVAIVTGSTRGLGKAIALALAREGADVVVNYCVSESEAGQVVNKIEELGRRSIAIRADVANSEDAKALIHSARDQMGALDILVNSAGLVSLDTHSDTFEVTEETWDRMMAIDVKGTWLCSREAGRIMVEQKHGKIINMSCSYGNAAFSYNPIPILYSTAKGAIRGLTIALARDFAPYVQVNAVAPGVIATGWEKVWEASPEEVAQTVGRTQVQRLGKPSEVGETVAYLASSGADYVTGQTILIDGGWVMA